MIRGNRHHARIAALCICAAGALIATSSATAAVTIGQLAPGTPDANCPLSTGRDYLQPSVTGGTLYVAREAGTITSWTTNSSGAGATYVLKVYRRTSDPDSFQVIAQSQPQHISAGINTLPVNLAVKSGDMIGYHVSGPANSCAFTQLFDNVLFRNGDLADGASGTFAPQNDVRLNLLAVLVPDNSFTFGTITRDRRRGTATVSVNTSNPGLVAIAGKGMKKRPSKNLAVAGPATFSVATVGKTKHKLERKRRIALPVSVTFFPIGGDPTTQTITLRLRRTRPPAPV